MSRLPDAIVKHIACSGPLSRAILDPFFEGVPHGSSPIASIVMSIIPHIGDIAAHYVGHHVLRRAFESADIKVIILGKLYAHIPFFFSL